MGNLLKESFTYQVLMAMGRFIQRLFTESFLIGVFTKESSNQTLEDASIFERFMNQFIMLLRKIALRIKLDRVFDNSIFAKPFLWLSITVFLTPFIPTMLALGMLAFTALTLVLKILITPDFQLRYFRTNIWVMVFMGIILIAGFTSVSKAESLKIALLLTAFLFSYFVIINTVEKKGQLRILLYLFAISGTISAIYGLYQYVFGDLFAQAWIDENMFEDIRMRVYSTFENPNVYGEYLILVIPVVTALLWTEKGFFRKMILGGMLAVTMLAALLTFSRGCWLGIILEMAILLLLIDKRFIFLGIAGLLVLPFVLPETIMNRFLSIGNMGDSSTSYRVYIWLGTIAMLKDYWFSGVGLGKTSFNAVYPIYSYNGVITPHSHNLFLQLMTEYGVLGLFVFLVMIYQFYKESLIHMRKQKNIWLSSMVAAMTGFLLESLFDYTWYNYRVFLIFWMFTSLAFVSVKIVELESKKQVNNIENKG